MKKSTWPDKAHRLIAQECNREYLRANRLPNGRMRKKHRAYSVPPFANMLVECLRNNDEERAKALFLTYEGIEMVKEASAMVCGPDAETIGAVAAFAWEAATDPSAAFRENEQ